MSAAHTPGPWRVFVDNRVDGDGLVYISGFNIEHDSGEVVGCEGIYGYGNCEANARLIAAAPELLEALIKCRDELAGLPHSLAYDFTHLPALDALIRKATQP